MPRVRFLLVAGFITCGLLALSALVLPAERTIYAARRRPATSWSCRDSECLHGPGEPRHELRRTARTARRPLRKNTVSGASFTSSSTCPRFPRRRFCERETAALPGERYRRRSVLDLVMDRACAWSESTITWANQPWPASPSGPQQDCRRSPAGRSGTSPRSWTHGYLALQPMASCWRVTTSLSPTMSSPRGSARHRPNW